MPTEVIVPNIGLVQFPDGMSQEEMIDKIKNQLLPKFSSQSPPPANPPVSMPTQGDPYAAMNPVERDYLGAQLRAKARADQAKADAAMADVRTKQLQQNAAQMVPDIGKMTQQVADVVGEGVNTAWDLARDVGRSWGLNLPGRTDVQEGIVQGTKEIPTIPGRAAKAGGEYVYGGVEDLIDIPLGGAQKPFENVRALAAGEPMPTAEVINRMPTVPKVLSTVVKTLPEFALQMLMAKGVQAGGVPHPIATGTIFASTPEGINLASGAMMATLGPVGDYTGKYIYELGNKVLKEHGIQMSAAQAMALRQAGNALGMQAYIDASNLPNYLSMTPEQFKEAWAHSLTMNLGMQLPALLGIRRTQQMERLMKESQKSLVEGANVGPWSQDQLMTEFQKNLAKQGQTLKGTPGQPPGVIGDQAEAAKVLAQTKGPENASTVSGSQKVPAQAGLPAQEGQGNLGPNLEQQASQQPKPVVEGEKGAGEVKAGPQVASTYTPADVERVKQKTMSGETLTPEEVVIVEAEKVKANKLIQSNWEQAAGMSESDFQRWQYPRLTEKPAQERDFFEMLDLLKAKLKRKDSRPEHIQKIAEAIIYNAGRLEDWGEIQKRAKENGDEMSEEEAKLIASSNVEFNKQINPVAKEAKALLDAYNQKGKPAPAAPTTAPAKGAKLAKGQQKPVAVTTTTPEPAKPAPKPVEEPPVNKDLVEAEAAIDDYEIDPESTRGKGAALARKLAKKGLFSEKALAEIERIAKDRDMGPEDIAPLLRDGLTPPKPAEKPAAPPAPASPLKVGKQAKPVKAKAPAPEPVVALPAGAEIKPGDKVTVRYTVNHKPVEENVTVLSVDPKGNMFKAHKGNKDNAQTYFKSYIVREGQEPAKPTKASLALMEEQRGVKVEDIDSILATAFHNRLAGLVVPVRSARELPEAVRKELRTKFSVDDTRAEAVWDGERVWMIARNLKPSEVQGKVFHEAAIHAGLRKALGEEKFSELMRRIAFTLTTEDLNELEKFGLSLKNENVTGLEVAEEWLARMAEKHNQLPSTWDKVVHWIREAIRSLGINMDFTDGEIRSMVQKGLAEAQAMATERDTMANRIRRAYNEKGAPVGEKELFRYSLKPEYRQTLEEQIAKGDPNAEHFQKALDIQRELDRNKLFWKINPEKSWMEDNKEYWKSVDPDLLCQRSEGTDAAVHYLKQVLGDKYDKSMAWEIIARANEEGLQTPCPQCYVFSGRTKTGTILQKPYIVGIGGYAGELLRTKEAALEKLVKRALRHYSSTDFKAEHIPGLVVETVQAAQKGIPVGAYSKQKDYPIIFGPTGAHINLSVGRNEEVGMNMADALEMRRQFKNVGTVYVPFSDAETVEALKNSNVDHVIPWHGSGQALKELRLRLDDPTLKDYQQYRYKGKLGFYQNDTYWDPENQKFLKADNGVKDWEHNGDLNTYLRLVNERGLMKRFPQIFDMLQKEGRLDVYMKLIGPEYGKFGGKYPYEPVVAQFNYDAIPQALKNRLKTRLGSTKDFIDIAKGIVKEVNRGTFEAKAETTPEVVEGPLERTFTAKKEGGKIIRASLAEEEPPRVELEGQESKLRASLSPEEAQWQVAGKTTVAQMAEPVVKDYRDAATALDTERFQEVGFDKAKRELRRLAEFAATEAERAKVPINKWPQPKDPNFAQQLNALGIKVDPAKIQSLQQQIALENAARIYVERVNRLVGINRDIEALKEGQKVSGVDMSQQIKRLTTWATRLSNKLAATEAKYPNVKMRGDDILRAEEDKLDNKGKQEALLNKHVQEVIGKPLDQKDSLLEKYTTLAKDYWDMLKDPNVSRELKQTTATTLYHTIEDFLAAKNDFLGDYQRRIGRVSDRLRELDSEMKDWDLKKAASDILLTSAIQARSGVHDLTGTTEATDRLDRLKQQLEAIKEFAKKLVHPANQRSAQAIWEMLVDPRGTETVEPASGEPYTYMPVAPLRAEDFGVGKEVFDDIVKTLQESAPFRDAVQVLSKMSDREMAKVTFTPKYLDEIAKLADKAKAGNVLAGQLADTMEGWLKEKAKLQGRAADAAMRPLTKEIEDLTVEAKALEYAKALFESVTGTEARPNNNFTDLQKSVADMIGAKRRMIVENNEFRTYRGFGKRPALKIDAALTPFTRRDSFSKVVQWWQDAEDYVKGYDQALFEYENGLSNQTPEQKGFNKADRDGIVEAMDTEWFRDMDGSILDANVRFRYPDIERGLLKLGYWRQLLRAAQLYNGHEGQLLRTMIVQNENMMQEIAAVMHRHNKFFEFRKKALWSHPEFNGSVEDYVEQVWNPMAHEGRRHGSGLGVGSKLPWYSQTVTKEDMAYLKYFLEMEQELKKVSEKFGGRTALRPTDDMYRRMASVGDFGMQRIPFTRAIDFIHKLVNAYGMEGEGKPEERIKTFNPENVDLSLSSPNPVVRFWNEHLREVISHILDYDRLDRTVKVDDYMRQAEEALSQRIRRKNGFEDLRSLQDIIDALSAPGIFPSNTGLPVRDYVRTRFFDELQQYAKNAYDMGPKRGKEEKDTSGMYRNISAASEWTREAAQLMLPSSLYDYGAVSNSQLAHMTRRINHESDIRVATAMHRLLNSLNAEHKALKDALDKGLPLPSNYKGGLKEIEAVRITLDRLLKDWTLSIDSGKDLERMGLPRRTFRTIATWMLAPAPVWLRNIFLGAMAPMKLGMELGRVSRGLGLWMALRHDARVVKNVGVALSKALGYYAPKAAADWWIKGKGRDAADSFAKYLSGVMYEHMLNSNREVMDLGFSLRDPYWWKVQELRDHMTVFESRSDVQQAKTLLGRVRRGVEAYLDVAELTGKQLGTSWADLFINSSALVDARVYADMIKDLAKVYGENRKDFGRFNPAETRWQVRPEEFSNRRTQAGRGTNLAALRRLMDFSGSSLEAVLWDYYQRYQKDPNAPLFDNKGFTDLERAVIREYNAGGRLNRPLLPRVNPIANVLMTFQNYASDFMVKTAEAFGTLPELKWYEKAGMLAATLFIGGIGMALNGLISQGTVDGYKRKVQNVEPRGYTVLDEKFWTDPKVTAKATVLGMLSTMPGLGDLALALMNSVSQNRGYDPASRVVAFNMANSIFGAIRAMGQLPPKDWDLPFWDVYRQYAPFSRETMAMMPNGAALRDYFNAANAYRREMDAQGIKTPVKASAGSYAYSPTSGIRAKMAAALMSGDDSGAREQFDRLVQHYVDKGVDNPQASAIRDFEAAHPVIKAMGGRTPTPEEYSAIYGGLDSGAKEQVDAANEAWNRGRQLLAPLSSPRIAGTAPGGSISGGGGGGGVGPSPAVPGRPYGVMVGRRGPSGISLGRTAGGIRVGRPVAIKRGLGVRAGRGALSSRRTGMRKPTARIKGIKLGRRKQGLRHR